MKSSLDKEALVGIRITDLLHSENWIGCAREEGLEGEQMLASEVDIKANILQEVHVLEWWQDLGYGSTKRVGWLRCWGVGGEWGIETCWDSTWKSEDMAMTNDQRKDDCFKN